MKPIEFPGVNVVFAKDQPEYMPLPAMRKEKKDGTPSKICFKTFSWYRNNVEKA